MTTVNLTEKEVHAIQVALDELKNSGEWAEHKEEDDVDEIFDSMESIEEKLDL